MTTNRYCTCGASIQASGLYEVAAASLWRQMHESNGHQQTDAKGAAKARRKAERENQKAMEAEG